MGAKFKEIQPVSAILPHHQLFNHQFCFVINRRWFITIKLILINVGAATASRLHNSTFPIPLRPEYAETGKLESEAVR